MGHGAILELDVGGEKQELGGTESWQNQEVGWPVYLLFPANVMNAQHTNGTVLSAL